MNTILKGDVWQGKIFQEVNLLITGINQSKNTVYAKVIHDDGSVDENVMSYRLDTFTDYYQPTEKVFTRVVFKLEEEEFSSQITPVACLLDCPANLYNILYYAYIGQHGEAPFTYFRNLKTANKDEYKDLFEELNSVGYAMQVLQKFPNGYCGWDS